MQNPIELMTNLLKKSFDVPVQVPSSHINEGQVEIDIAHRIGRRINGRIRPMVVRFTTRKAKDLVLAKSRGKKVLNIKVSEHYPSDMKERREAQIDALKTYRDIHKDTSTRVALVKDKLYVGQQIIDTTFENNKLQFIPTENVAPIHTISQTPVREINKSIFQGHAARVHSFKEAAAVKQSLYQFSQIANSDHLIYAYAITDENGIRITGNSDDGEWAASRLIADLISHKMETNIFIAVSRRHQGPNLGRTRFSVFSQIAQEALTTLNEK